jgi:hypothetical protein
MVTFKFKLIDSKVPVIKGKNIITDSNVGGTKNTYKIYEIRPYWFNKYLGTKTFLRPYQTIWDKKGNRLHAPYWGKGPLLNLWLVLMNNYNDISDIEVFRVESNTTKHCTKVFDINFKSQLLNKNLKLNQSFYQSNFVKV